VDKPSVRGVDRHADADSLRLVCHSPYVTLVTAYISFLLIPPPPRSTLFPYTTLFRSLSISPRSKKIGALLPAHSRSNPQSSEKRSEEHTSELQSRGHLVCRLLLEKKKG